MAVLPYVVSNRYLISTIQNGQVVSPFVFSFGNVQPLDPDATRVIGYTKPTSGSIVIATALYPHTRRISLSFLTSSRVCWMS